MRGRRAANDADRARYRALPRSGLLCSMLTSLAFGPGLIYSAEHFRRRGVSRQLLHLICLLGITHLTPISAAVACGGALSGTTPRYYRTGIRMPAAPATRSRTRATYYCNVRISAVGDLSGLLSWENSGRHHISSTVRANIRLGTARKTWRAGDTAVVELVTLMRVSNRAYSDGLDGWGRTWDVSPIILPTRLRRSAASSSHL